MLDESLVLSDLGISAYTGDNVSKGALSGFLKAMEIGRVPQGSILLVETLDRLSREALPEAVALLTSIVRGGVRVISMIDRHEWNNETIENTGSFLWSVLLFSKAHAESSHKAKRISDQFQAKRKARLPVVSKGHGPGWAVARADRQGWQLVEDKAAVVLKIFQLAVAGLGGIAISRKANEERWPIPWRERKNTNTRWEHTAISRLLRDRRTLGEWQPKKMVSGVLTPDGDPVADYFPQVVSDELWHQVQVALSTRVGRPPRIRGLQADVFAGLLYCKCGERMERKPPTARGYPRYYCLGRKHGMSTCPALAEAVLLGSVLSVIAQLEQAAFNPDSLAEQLREELLVNRSRLKELEANGQRLVDAIEGAGHSKLLLDRLAANEKETGKVKAAIDRADSTLRVAPVLDPLFGTRLAEMAAAAVTDKKDVAGRQRIALALQQTVNRITWRHTVIVVDAKSGATFMMNPPLGSLKRAKNRHAGKPGKPRGKSVMIEATPIEK